MTNALIEQSPFEAIQWVEGTVSGVNLNNVSIIGTGTFALQEQTGGAATFTNVTATGVAQANLGNDPSYNCEGTGFAITDDGGNSGISPAGCSVGDAPTPVYPPYPVTGVNASPTALTFSPTVVGSHQRRPDGDGRQPDQRGRHGLVHHRQRSVRRDQQLRLVDRGQQLLHRQRDVLADGSRRKHRQRHHQRRRGHQHGEPVRHRHGTGPGAERLPG